MHTTSKIQTLDPSAAILPEWASAAIYFVKDAGEYIFAARKENQTISKFLRPADVAAAFLHQENDTGWIGPHIIRIGNSARGPWFIYRRGAGKVSIRFDGDEGEYRIPIPPTVLVAVESSYYIFATKDDKPLQDETEIFHAPFPNTYDNGRICWGSNRPPKNESPDAGNKAWNLFFGSPFNEHLDAGHHASKTVKLLDLLKSLNGHKLFPAKMLVPHGYPLRTMKDVLAQIVHAKESEE